VTAVGRPKREATLRTIGAHEVVSSVEDASGLYDVILESVGGPFLSQAVLKVAPEGVILVFGFSSREPSAISFANFGGRTRARIESFYVYQSGEPPTFGDDLGFMAGLIESGQITPQIGFRGSWRDLAQGLDALRNRQAFGKVVLEVD
jgi:NADPH:quinone reductase